MPKPWAHGRPPSGSSLPPSALTRRFGVLLALVGVSLWLCLLGASYSSRPGPIITLASSSQRLNTTLPVAVSSLLSQSLPPSSINVYLPLEDRATVDLDALHPVFSHPTVHLSFVEDVGPSTKFIPMLRSLLDQGPPGLDKQVIVVDDDHAYSSELVRTLVRGFEREKGSVAVGLRGWRVREDCKWGVGPDELARHVVEGWKISAPYKVGVLTANEGYLVTPRMFVPPVELAQPDRTSFSSPLFDYDTPVPVAAHLVDDIWISGQLASLLIPRVVVPLPAPIPPSLDLTPPATATTGGSPLEKHLSSHSYSRGQANDDVLAYFRTAWAREAIWFDLTPGGGGDEARFVGIGKRVWSLVSKWAYWKRVQQEWGAVARWN